VRRLSRWGDSSVGLARGPRSPPQRPVPAGTGRWGICVGVPLPLLPRSEVPPRSRGPSWSSPPKPTARRAQSIAFGRRVRFGCRPFASRLAGEDSDRVREPRRRFSCRQAVRGVFHRRHVFHAYVLRVQGVVWRSGSRVVGCRRLPPRSLRGGRHCLRSSARPLPWRRVRRTFRRTRRRSRGLSPSLSVRVVARRLGQGRTGRPLS